MVARAPALAVRDAAEIVWWRRTPPVEGGETGTGGGEIGCVPCDDIAVMFYVFFSLTKLIG
jgi:hypothetical protein